MSHTPRSIVIIIMGVSGSGKTTIGKEVAMRQGWTFFDADDFHPAANVEKMRDGDGLTDTDRAPWLKQLRVLIDEVLREEESAVLACSALKKGYREQLAAEGVCFVYLKADRDLIRERLSEREGHYAKADLLESQFGALEEPASQENVVTVSVDQSIEAVVDEIEAALVAA